MARFPAPKSTAPSGGPGVTRVAAPAAKASGVQAIGGKPAVSPRDTDTPAAQRARQEARKAECEARRNETVARGEREQGY